MNNCINCPQKCLGPCLKIIKYHNYHSSYQTNSPLVIPNSKKCFWQCLFTQDDVLLDQNA